MKKKYAFIAIGVILAIAIGIFVTGSSMLGRIKRNKIPKTNEELGIKEEPKHIAGKKKDEDEKIINIVLFGLDRRDRYSTSRSDSIIVISIDSKNQKVKASSLMRDMYVPIPAHGENRINAAYAFGGPVLAIKTINSNFDLDIRNYIAVDFFGFEKLIDKLGGVEIDVNALEAKQLNIKSGLQTLNGKEAIAYSRIRYVGHADYERTERQRRVLNDIFKKIKSKGVTELPGIISTILPYIETSLTNGELIDLSRKVYGFNTEDIQEYRLPVDGYFKSKNIRGMSVLVPDIEENKKKLHEFIYENR